MSQIKRFARFFPATLARIQTGPKVNLRDRTVKPKGSFDLLTKNDVVEPIPSSQKKFTFPNGCSLRSPTSTTFQDVAEAFNGDNVKVFIIKEGTPIPDDLVLLYEKTDHFSLQCSKPMPLTELNTKITDFLERHATVMTRKEYQNKFPAGEDNDSLEISSLKDN